MITIIKYIPTLYPLVIPDNYKPPYINIRKGGRAKGR
jgi:hypothetical protein